MTNSGRHQPDQHPRDQHPRDQHPRDQHPRDQHPRDQHQRDQQTLLSSTEQALRDSEARYQTLFNSIDEGICILQMHFDQDDNPIDYRFLETNPTFEQLTGLIDPVGKTARELVPDLDEFWFQTYGRVALTGEPERFEHHAEAMERWFDVYAVRVSRPEDRQVALFFRDVTERKRINAELRESERRFRAMADTAPAMLWVTNTDNRCNFLSRGWYDYTGQTDEEGLGLGWLDAVHPDERDAAKRRFLEATEAHAPFSLDFRLRGADGVYRWAIDSGRPRFDDDGNWLGYIGSVIDVDERKKTEQALRQADEQKDQFMAVLSHELRNPLAPIRLSLDLLSMDEVSGESASRAREIIERQVDQLTGLIDDLLDVTRLNRQKIKLQRKTFDLGELVEHTVADHRSLFESKDIALELDVHDSPIVVHADRSRLGQVIGNLLHNAAKFTERGGRTSVSLSVDAATDSDEDRRAEIHVRDTGIGMSEKTLTYLFEPFIQADTSLDHSTGGLGLGLALVKGLVEQHGGDIQVESEGLGCGAEFVVRIPIADSAEADSEPTDSEMAESMIADPAMAESAVDTAAMSPSQANDTERLASRRVLIIEDNVDVADSLAAALELAGHSVEIARDGEEGIRRARRAQPEVVFCDIGLPDADGYTVARHLRDLPELRSTVLVALSGYAMPEDVDKSYEAGFDRHIAKPPKLSRLEEALAAAPRTPTEKGQ